jgi:hypothetical protein
MAASQQGDVASVAEGPLRHQQTCADQPRTRIAQVS